MVRKNWQPSIIKQLLYLYKKKIPLKILSQWFDVTPNAISKTLQRYSLDHSNILDNMDYNINTYWDSLFQWMNNNYLLFKEIFHSKEDISIKTIAINKILYNHNWEPLNIDTINNMIFRLKYEAFNRRKNGMPMVNN